MGKDQTVKKRKRDTILAMFFFLIAAILLLTACISLAACHLNVSAQLEQGVPVKGNELAIVNLYMTSCVQYVALAALLAFCGLVLRQKSVEKEDTAVEYMLPVHDASFEAVNISNGEEVEPEDDDSDFSEWKVREEEI